MFSIFKKSDKATDPICLMKIAKDITKFKYIYKEKTYYFCSQNCQDEFAKNPERHID